MLPLMRDKAWCQRQDEAHSIRRRAVAVTDIGKRMNGSYLLRNIAVTDGNVLGARPMVWVREDKQTSFVIIFPGER